MRAWSRAGCFACSRDRSAESVPGHRKRSGRAAARCCRARAASAPECPRRVRPPSSPRKVGERESQRVRIAERQARTGVLEAVQPECVRVRRHRRRSAVVPTKCQPRPTMLRPSAASAGGAWAAGRSGSRDGSIGCSSYGIRSAWTIARRCVIRRCIACRGRLATAGCAVVVEADAVRAISRVPQPPAPRVRWPSVILRAVNGTASGCGASPDSPRPPRAGPASVAHARIEPVRVAARPEADPVGTGLPAWRGVAVRLRRAVRGGRTRTASRRASATAGTRARRAGGGPCPSPSAQAGTPNRR